MVFRKRRSLFRKIVRNEKGSFTVEASLVFPLIFLITLAFILISVYVFEYVRLYYVASQAAERTAYNWANSNKNPYTGEFPLGQYDDLYWRLTDDNVLGFILKNIESYQLTEIKIGEENVVETLPQMKLETMANEIPSGINGSLIYSNNIIEKKITVKLQSPVKINELLNKVLGSEINATATSAITDPTEFIRTVNLITKNAGKLANMDKSKNTLNKNKKQK